MNVDERIEEIARECAEALITVEDTDPPSGESWVCVGRSPTRSGDAHLYRNRQDAEYDAAIYRDNAAPLVAAALRRLRDEMNAGPLPPPASAARLAEIA